nr:MAG TPA: hypothetical protein [Caudoviricetes sp.]
MNTSSARGAKYSKALVYFPSSYIRVLPGRVLPFF